MAEWQHILIDGASSRADVTALVARFLGTEPDPIDGGLAFRVADAWVGVFDADYADEGDLHMSMYRWVIDVDGAAQQVWGRRIFDALAAETRWSLLWQSNSVLVEVRTAGSAA